jgi:putative oxidoreductase
MAIDEGMLFMNARPEDVILLLARLLMAALFLPSGFGKLLGFAGFAASLANQGMPLPTLMAAAGVAIEILGPLALIAGVVPRPTAIVLAVFVVMATLISHRFWEFSDQARRAQSVNFWKNAAIVGGLMFYFVSGPGALSLSPARERRNVPGSFDLLRWR